MITHHLSLSVVGTQDVKQNPVMVYMKGVPQAPQCGFSAMVVRIFGGICRANPVAFHSGDPNLCRFSLKII